MTDNENASISFEEVWKSLEEQDKTGVYKRAREMADIAVEQLEYAYNSGYKTAKAKYERPQGEWIYRKEWFEDEPEERMAWGCSSCGFSIQNSHDKKNYCPYCGADMKGRRLDNE